ncbi:hypothetical protein F2Q68_00011297 [Brassica cretica]|uniref:DUF223 domain-containing protein n=2 Tax=Brassica cretica TaxID=69181 RepID=A0ABQ7F792_BRACR|nr:hypothetical protein F2Q68_00011297 [Brassica cretica]KAF3611505.1 hypothetical protein DY000_02048690 [Brassica cretica]
MIKKDDRRNIISQIFDTQNLTHKWTRVDGIVIRWWEGVVVERFNRDSKHPWVINGVESIVSLTVQGDEFQTEQHDRSFTQRFLTKMRLTHHSTTSIVN